MSEGYAERLSEYPNKGVCGLPESYDSVRSLTSKLDTLAKLIRTSSHTVVLTGAGCSTSAGIPDFRGPNGIWTREQKEKKKKKKGKKRKADVAKSEDIEEKVAEGPTWVQCDLCKKWRRIPTSKTSDLPAHWECSMNTDNDPNYSKCSDPEEGYNKGSWIQSGTTPKASDIPDAEKADSVAILGSTNAMKTKPANNAVEPNNAVKQSIPSFASAVPTYTHRALTHLILQPPPPKAHNTGSDDSCGDESSTPQSQRTYLHHIVTQNIDGLHRKSRLPRKHHSILHGDIFTELCDTCHTEHVRSYEISSIGLSYTGRECTLGGTPAGSCKGKLKDTLLDWESDLPDVDWQRAQDECHNADLIICLGTSLRIEPAASLCTLAQPDLSATTREEKRRNQKKLGYVIVNLQTTPYDDQASLVVRGKVDDVMEGLMQRLGYEKDWDDLFDYGKKK